MHLVAVPKKTENVNEAKQIMWNLLFSATQHLSEGRYVAFKKY